MALPNSLSLKARRLALGAPPRVLDPFAGCGGLSLGFHRAGCSIVAGVDSDPHAAATHARNFHGGAGAHARPRDLTDPTVTPASLSAELDLGPIEAAVDIVVGRPPCQAFAHIGRAKLRAVAQDPETFLNDPRASLHERWRPGSAR